MFYSNNINMGSDNNNNDRQNPDYLAQLLKDKRQMQTFSNVFIHLERILDEEINRVRVNLFHQNTSKEPLQLPDQLGQVVTLTEKQYVPVKDHPDFNFVGRILGPRGMTAKQLEQETGCKIMVRGKGSMRDRKKEEMNKGKPNWEHLDEDLHVLITVEDTKNRASIKLKRAIEEVKKLLIPSPEGEDDLKKLQLMELAIINGTYRDGNRPCNLPIQNTSQMPPMITTTQIAMSPTIMRSPGPAGAPIILAPRLPLFTTGPMPSPGMMNGGPPPVMSPGEQGMFYQFDPNYITIQSPIYEYSTNCMENHNVVVSMPYVR